MWWRMLIPSKRHCDGSDLIVEALKMVSRIFLIASCHRTVWVVRRLTIRHLLTGWHTCISAHKITRLVKRTSLPMEGCIYPTQGMRCVRLRYYYIQIYIRRQQTHAMIQAKLLGWHLPKGFSVLVLVRTRTSNSVLSRPQASGRQKSKPNASITRTAAKSFLSPILLRIQLTSQKKTLAWYH